MGHPIVWIILVLSLAGGAITFFMKRDGKLFWSLFVIALTNLALGLFFVIYVNIVIGSILSIVVVAMIGFSILRSRRSSI